MCCVSLLSKLCVNRLRNVLPDLVENQSAYVHERFIIHNIMVCQDIIVRCYGRSSVASTCLMKLDMRKAYDTVDWDFLEKMMVGLLFPKKFTVCDDLCENSKVFIDDQRVTSWFFLLKKRFEVAGSYFPTPFCYLYELFDHGAEKGK